MFLLIDKNIFKFMFGFIIILSILFFIKYIQALIVVRKRFKCSWLKAICIIDGERYETSKN